MLEKHKLFLEHLGGKGYPSSDLSKDLAQIPDVDFEKENYSSLGLTPSDECLQDEVAKILAQKVPFSKKRCEALIELKQKMEAMGVKGYALPQTESRKAANDQNRHFGDLNNLGISGDTKELLRDFRCDADLQTDIQQSNIPKIRAKLASYLNNKRVDLEFLIKLMAYVYHEFPEVFEEYTASKLHPLFSEETSDWSEDYFYTQKTYLSLNFALERFFHLINVRQHLANNNHPNFQMIVKEEPVDQKTFGNHTETSSSTKKNTHSGKQDGYHFDDTAKTFIKVALAVGGAVLAIVMLIWK